MSSNSGYYGIAMACMVCAFLIVAYGTWRCKNPDFVDPLTQTLIGGEEMSKYTDGWGLTHFTFYAMLTYYYPQHATFIFVLGTLWEFIESASKTKPFYLGECHASVDTDKKAGWWYGRWQDVVMNTLGQVLGYQLRMRKVSPGIFAIMYAAIIGYAFELQKKKAKDIPKN